MKSQSETTQTMSALKLLVLKTMEYDLWSMRMKQYLAFTDHALWEVKVIGDSVSPDASGSTGVEGPISPKTAEQTLIRKNELKAKNTLMLAIPDEDLLKFHTCKDAKSLWEAIKNSLPSTWNNIALIMKNKYDLDTLSMDDLYNNLKVYESEIKIQLSSSSNSQNVAFVSLDNTSSINETFNTAYSVSTASSKDQVFTASYADDTDTDDLEEMDLKWQVAILTIRAKRFIKKTGRKLDLNGKETVGFDRRKFECYNCHRIGHFARECRAPRNQWNRNRDAPIRNAPMDTSTTNALVVQDGICGYDWNFQAEEELINFSLMAYTSQDKTGHGYDGQINESDLNDIHVNESEVLNNVVDSHEINGDDNQVMIDSKDENMFKPEEVKKTVKPSLEKNEFVKARYTTFKNENKAENPGKFSQSPRGNKRILNGLITQKPWDGFEFKKKACFACGIFNHLIKDYDFYKNKIVLNNKGMFTGQKEIRLVWDNTAKVNHQNKLTHPHHKRNFVPAVVLTKSRQVPVNAAKQSSHRVATSLSVARRVNTAASRPNVNDALPTKYSYFEAHAPIRRPFNQKSAAKTNNSMKKLMLLRFIAFGENAKEGKITRKCKIRIGKLDFKDVYFVKELKFNLFSVSQMCDKKNSVLFIDTECVVLSLDFKLLDKSQVLVKSNFDESNLWHRRLGHINFKTMNKLVRGNLVRGIENQIDHKVKTIRCDNRTELKNRIMNEFCEMKGYSINMKVFRVFNTRTRFVEENMHINFLEDKLNVVGTGPNWMFDIDILTMAMNYQLVFAGNQTNGNAGPKSLENVVTDARKKSTKVLRKENEVQDLAKEGDKMIKRRILNTVSLPVNTVSFSFTIVNPRSERAQMNEFKNMFGQDKDANDNSTYRMFTPMDVKSAFLYGTMKKEVYVCEPLGFEDSHFLERIDAQELPDEFYGRTYFLLRVAVKTSSTPIETNKALLKDEEAEDVDVHLHRSMIRSLMYLTSSRPDIILQRYSLRDYYCWLKTYCCWCKLMLLDDAVDIKIRLPEQSAAIGKIRIEHYFLMTDYSLWEVILNGDSPVPIRVIEGVVQPVALTTAEQRLARKNELKACEKRFGGNKETKKVQKTLLKQQYENFTGSSSESLDQIHDRLQKLISQLEILGESLYLEDQSLDDLFNILKIYKAKVKSSSSASTSTPNITFVSSQNTDSTNEPVSVVASVSDASAIILVFDLPNVDTLNADDLEEMDLKWQMAMLTSLKGEVCQWRLLRLMPWYHNVMGWEAMTRSFRQKKNQPTMPSQLLHPQVLPFLIISSESDVSMPASPVYDRYQSGEGYHAIPPYIGTFMPPKPDLAPIIEHWVSDSEDDSEANPTQNTLGNLHHALEDKRVIDSRCSRHMIGNMSYLSDFEEINGGYVSFGGNPKGGKISSKGKIRIGKLDFDDVYFVNELKFNLFSVSQMCDKKNNVLFTDTKCIVLSLEFKLPDENQVLLRVFRENNMYNVDLKNIVPTRDLTCLFAKATLDESNLWHRRLGHINFNTMNKLVKVVIDDYSRFTWVFFLATKDETSPILKTFITGIENQLSLKREFSVPITPQQNGIDERKNRTLIEAARTMLADSLLPIPFWAEAVNTACYAQNRVLVTKPQNKTPYELLLSRTPIIGCMRPFGCLVTILNTLDPLEKAWEENVQQYVLFPLWSSSSKNPQNTDDDDSFEVKEPEFEGKKPESEVHVSPTNSAKTKKHDDKTTKKAKGKSPVELSKGYINLSAEFEDFFDNSINEVNTASTLVFAVGQISTNSTNTFSVAALEDITYSDDEEDVGTEADFSNLETTITVSPIPTTRVHKDHHEELLQFKMQKVWVLVDLPNRKRAIGHTQEEVIDYEEVFAPVARIEAIRLFLAYDSFMGFMVYQMDVKSAFLYGTIEEEVYVCQPPRFEDPDYPDNVYKVVKALYGLHQAPRACQDKYVDEILRKFGLTDKKSASTLIDTEKPLLKDPDSEDVDVHIYRSMIGSLMYLTSSRPDIMFAFCVNDVTRLQALIDRKKVIITKATVQEALRLDDDESIDCLPNEEIFTELSRMGYEKPSTKLTFYKAFFLPQWKFLIHTILQCMSAKRTSWNELSSSMASAVICLSTCSKFNFSKYIFDSLVRNMDSSSKFYMYLGFLQLMIRAQVCDLSSHTTKYSSLALTQKVFANIRRVGMRFSGVETPLFKGMIVEQQADEGAASVDVDDVHASDAKPSIPSPTPTTQPPPPSQELPSTSQDDKSKPAKLKEVVEVVTTAKLMTEVVIAAATIATAPNVARRRKGVVIRDPAPSIIIHSESKSKDKGKRIMVQEHKPIKKQAQIEQDEAYARELEAELNKNINWNDVIEQVQRKEKEDNVVLRYQALKRKPQTEAQARKNIMIYLRNIDGFKMDYFKRISYDDIRLIFEKYFKSNVAFLEKTKEQLEEEDNRALKRKVKTFEEKAAKKQKLDEEVYGLQLMIESCGLRFMLPKICQKGIPDDRPILLKEYKVDYGLTPFWFYHFWMEMEGFHKLVVDTWNNDDQRCASKDDFKNQRDFIHIIRELDHLEAKDITQKSRIKCAMEGDENTSFFYGTLKKKRRHLAIKEPDVTRFVLEFSHSVTFPKGCNSSFIALVPKVSNAKFITDFCPINLIGCQYTIIDKILANRLSTVIGCCISAEQSAFIKGKNILDGALVLNEIIDWYHKCKKELMIFNVDFEKAFDSLRWTIGAQSSLVPTPLHDDLYVAVRQAHLADMHIESEPVEDLRKTEVPQPLLVLPSPVSLSDDLYLTYRQAYTPVTVDTKLEPEEAPSKIEEGIGVHQLVEDTKDESSDPSTKREGSQGESHGSEDEGPGSDDEGPGLDDEGLDSEDEGPGLSYGGLRHRELELGEGSVPSTFKITHISRSMLGQQRVEETPTPRLRVHTIWTPPSPGWSFGSLPASPSSLSITTPVASLVTTPAATIAVGEDEFLEVGVQLELHESIFLDHTQCLDALPPALFKGYYRDLMELYTSAIWRPILALEACLGQTDAQRAALWHAIYDTQRENHDLRMQINVERREQLELTYCIDRMERRHKSIRE
uniref:Ribonuclease H-like domain-containing protein n=1 Tax=Tanacetum cinerariifolium TaxID=118510 RepID=A0A6L2JSD8_TANCI|nr:ribonuclease H-like domain-containing protein [Tanacetum cinerariifolium]